MNVKDASLVVVANAGRPIRSDEIHKILTGTGMQCEKSTVGHFMSELLKEGKVGRANFAAASGTRSNYYTMPVERYSFNFQCVGMMDLFEDRVKGTGKWGTEYVGFVDSSIVPRVASVVKYFVNADADVVSKMYRAFLELYSPDASLPLFGFTRNITIHAFDGETSFKEIDRDDLPITEPFRFHELGARNWQRVAVEVGGSTSPFFVMNGWDAVEKLRFMNIVAALDGGKKPAMPIPVSVVITNESDVAVNRVKECYMLMDAENAYNSIVRQNVIGRLSNIITANRIRSDANLNAEKERLDAEEGSIKGQMADLKAKMKDIMARRESLKKMPGLVDTPR